MATRWIIPPMGLIEPAVAPEFFIDGVGAIEAIGGCIRVYYCAEQMPLEAAGAQPQKIVMVKIVRPIATIPDAIGRLARCLVPIVESVPVDGGPWPRLVT